MKRAIITGADGFIGSHAVKCFLENSVEVLAIGLSETPKRLICHPKLTYMQADISKSDLWKNEVQINYYDVFVHFAWAGSAGPARYDHHLQMNNALWTVECLKLSKELGCKRFVGAGSIMEKEAIAVVDTRFSKPGMAYIYGMGKLAAHHLCKAIAGDIETEFIWAMVTNAYGEGELSPRFVNTTIRKIINGEPLQFTAATQNYDFIHVSDVARAFYLIAKNGKPFCEYLIGSGKAKPLKEFILEMQQALAPDVAPIFGDIPFTGVSMPIDAFDVSDTEKDTGFKAEISFAEGTSKTMEWLKQIQ